MMFLFIIMGATHGKAPAGFAPIAIGLGLTLIHLVGIPITTAGSHGVTVTVQVFGVDLAGNRGQRAIRKLTIE